MKWQNKQGAGLVSQRLGVQDSAEERDDVNERCWKKERMNRKNV